MSDTKILIHGCCAHCTAYTVEHWRQAGWDVTVLWYNPNVHPFTEHQNRLEAMKTLADRMDFPLIVAGSYDIAEYFRRVSGHEAERCRCCFELRLNKTAATAAELGIPAFSTSLLISPHQKHELIPLCGELAATRHRLIFSMLTCANVTPTAATLPNPWSFIASNTAAAFSANGNAMPNPHHPTRSRSHNGTQP